jgi:hypothetical protein
VIPKTIDEVRWLLTILGLGERRLCSFLFCLFINIYYEKFVVQIPCMSKTGATCS